MSVPAIEQHGLFLAGDSGPKAGSNDYTTLVMIHGYTWHSGLFSHMLPFAESHNSRIILVNRRDYPGAAPYSEEEMCLLASTTPDTPEAATNIKVFTEARARELYDFLVTLVKTKNITVDGGIALAGWSFGTVWLNAFLAYVPTFPVGDIDLRRYIRSVVMYDTPFRMMGYPVPGPDFYHPLLEMAFTPEERLANFQGWVSGYFKHGDSAAELEQRVYLDKPVPTILIMSGDDIAAAMYLPPANPGGSDILYLQNGINHELFGYLKDRMLYPSPTPSDWDGVGIRYVWCDHSPWETVWSAWAFQAELDEAEKTGKKTRKVTFKRIVGGNHFAHWDQPELTLQALLGSS